MKSPAAYYLFLLYMFALCKPVLPLVQDIVAHTFFEHQHLASVHKDGGKNHVSKEVGKLTKEDSASNTDSLKSYDDVPLHLLSSFSLYFNNSTGLLLHSETLTCLIFPSVSIAIQLPPPRPFVFAQLHS